MFGERPTREDSVRGRIRKRPRQLTRARPSLGRKRPRSGAVLKEPQLPGVRGGVGGQSSRGHVPRTPHQIFSEGPHQVSDITEATIAFVMLGAERSSSTAYPSAE